jgi:hypothetical protein
MKSLLSAVVAVAFAASGVNAFAQAKDVNTKQGAVTDKGGQQVKTRVIKENPKYEPLPKIEQKPKKEKISGDVKTKGGGPVSTKDQKPVTTSTPK